MSMTTWMNEMKSAMNGKASHTKVINMQEREKQFKRALKFSLCASAACLVAMEPGIAMAGAFGNIETVAGRILTFVTGTFGKTVATIAVVVLGMMAMFGKLAWDHALKVIFGIAIVFGSASVINALTPTMTTGPATGSGASTTATDTP